MYRVGIGEDLHRVDDGRPLVLGGILIEEGPGLAGHSDSDVLLHAITDAILGGAGLGDIGHHFPPSDPRYAHADSADFVRRAVSLAAGDGWSIANVDSTIRTERPMLKPYVALMKERIAGILGIGVACVNVKAKTAEGLDAVGRGEAMVATAVVLLSRREGPASPA